MEIITDAEVEELARERVRALRLKPPLSNYDLDSLSRLIKLRSKIKKEFYGRSNKSFRNK